MARSGRTKANRKRSKRARSPWRGVGRLAALLGFSLAALGLVALVFRVDAEPSVWDTLFVDSPTGQHAFHERDLYVIRRESRHRDLYARDGDGVHTVWFANGRDDAPAFRLTSELTLAGARMDGVLELFAAHYGRPVASRCERSRVLDTVKCHYRWLTKGSVSIDLYVTGDRADGYEHENSRRRGRHQP